MLVECPQVQRLYLSGCFSDLLDTLWLSNDVQKFLSKMLGLDFT